MITRVLGVVIIVLGLVFAGVISSATATCGSRVPAAGVAAAPLLGVVFALGLDALHRPGARRGDQPRPERGHGTARWACSGFATRSGLGIPFVIAGLAFAKMTRTVGFLRRHQVSR